jgi:phosphopantothenoylcysteine decarboxylase/phosphopantothenate--cysteine ligase
MGVALAEAARAAGHPVTFLHGALAVAPPLGVERVAVGSAREMLSSLERLSASHPILIMAAAVADYRIARPERSKIPSGRRDLSLTLVPNPDLLSTIGASRAGMITVGFALETEGNRARAREKMSRKGCDMMVMNNPRKRGSEFGGDTNQVVILYADGREEELPLLPKTEVAREVMRRVMALSPRSAPAARGKRASPAPGSKERPRRTR